MPIKLITGQLYSELRSLPVTLLVIVGLVAFSYWSFYNQARAETVREVKSEVTEIKQAVDQILTLQLTELIEDLHQQWCGEKNSLRRRSIYLSIRKFQNDLRQVSKEIHRPLTCLT